MLERRTHVLTIICGIPVGVANYVRVEASIPDHIVHYLMCAVVGYFCIAILGGASAGFTSAFSGSKMNDEFWDDSIPTIAISFAMLSMGYLFFELQRLTQL